MLFFHSFFSFAESAALLLDDRKCKEEDSDADGDGDDNDGRVIKDVAERKEQGKRRTSKKKN